MKAAQGIFAQLLFIAFASTCLAQAQVGPTSWDKRTPLDEALDLYQDFSGKTVLRSPNLPSLSEFNKPIPSTDTNGMKVVLENELLQHGIQFIPHREVFALAVAAGWSNSPEAQFLATLKPRPTDASPSASLIPNPIDQTPGQEAIPPGTIDFRGADFNQFADLYSMLLHRTILHPSQISCPLFKLRTQTPLTKTGAIYLSELALALNGIAVADDGTNFVQVVSLRQLSDLRLQAPQRQTDEPLIERDDIRPFGGRQFIPGKASKPLRTSANDVVAYYAELTGRSAAPSEKAGRQFILFKAQTRLTKPELLYALETTLALNGLAIIEVDEKTIQVGYVHERKRAERKSQ
jgi:hypothetical protein